MTIDSHKPETDSPPPPPRPEYGSHEDAFDKAAQPEPDDEEFSDFVVPRAANDEVWAEAHERGDLRPDGRPVTEVGWSPELNEDWIGSIVENRAIVYLGSEPAGDNLDSSDHQHPSVFSTEIDQLQDAGYHQVGDYMVPEKLAQAFAERNPPPTDEE